MKVVLLRSDGSGRSITATAACANSFDTSRLGHLIPSPFGPKAGRESFEDILGGFNSSMKRRISRTKSETCSIPHHVSDWRLFSFPVVNAEMSQLLVREPAWIRRVRARVFSSLQRRDTWFYFGPTMDPHASSTPTSLHRTLPGSLMPSHKATRHSLFT
jgi:hypothetical protein